MERDLPDIARGGIPIEQINPQPEIRKVAETANWDFQQEAIKLYRRADVIIDRFYPVIHTPQFQGRLPSVLIAIDSERNKKVLASYRLIPDEYGLSFKINMNKQHYIDGTDEESNKIKIWRFDEWAQMETLVHEIGHHWQQMLGDNPYKIGSRVTHNSEFCDKMAQLGIHCATEGYHTKIADTDSPFGQLMREWGIKPPEAVPQAESEIHWFREHFKSREAKGRSTLMKYTCECGQNIRVGKKEWPGAACNACGSQYAEV